MKFLRSRFTAHTRFVASLGISVASLGFAGTTFGFTRSGTTLITDGSFADVSSAVGSANAGDTVSIPAGSFTWGTSNTFIAVTKPITLSGAGTGSTTINLAATAPSATSGTIRLSARALVKDFTIMTPSSGGNPTAFSIGPTAAGFRITNINYDNSNNHGYYAVYAGAYGLIDSCTFTTGTATQEPIFVRGPLDSWQTPNSLGSSDALYVEDCIFSGPGYVCDVNDNGRAVFRFNTMTGHNKIDGHGYASNSLRGVRQMEVYGNVWTAESGFWWAIQIRGGTGMVFDNTSVNGTNNQVEMELKEYGATGLWPNFGNLYQTPINYPIKDQVGVGEDPKVGGSEPYYLWNNIKAGVPWQLTWSAIPAGAVTYYQTQTSNPNATYTMQDIIGADRDYFFGAASFDGTSGIGTGTKAQMLAITGKKVGVGFWVTDEGDWNEKHPGPDGQLYVWNGSAWQLKYTPYTYPHPLRGSAVPYNAPLNTRVRIQPPRTK